MLKSITYAQAAGRRNSSDRIMMILTGELFHNILIEKSMLFVCDVH